MAMDMNCSCWEINTDSNFLEFKPSEIAAAVVISISREAQDTDIDEAIASFVIVQKVKMVISMHIEWESG